MVTFNFTAVVTWELSRGNGMYLPLLVNVIPSGVAILWSGAEEDK
jgi:hypothetical protein